MNGGLVMRYSGAFAATIIGMGLALPGCAGGQIARAVATSRPAADGQPQTATYIRRHYTKEIHRIPMRDGVKLFTIVYAPKDTSRQWPILMTRTPYSVAPYEQAEHRRSLGPSSLFAKAGYIFVYQDVRGRYLSEGEFENVRPHIERKLRATDIDESTDARDTIDYLLKNVSNHNGRIGMWGISYPGFYCSAGMIDAHPALKAVSPQAPIGDWFFDDFHHYGAFFLMDSFTLLSNFGLPRPTPTPRRAERIDIGTPDGYQFFLDAGPLKNIDARHFHGEIRFWTQMTRHPNYDDFWRARNILPHLRRVAPAVLMVGGWFDAEDLYGTFNTYQTIEKQNPGIVNTLAVGPWRHAGWAKDDGERLGDIAFGDKTSGFYQQNIELPFFERYLKDKPDPKLPEAYVFETGRNVWRTFDHWPPVGVREKALYVRAGGALAWDSPAAEPSPSCDTFTSDPARPVPFTQAITAATPPEHMTEDQRFAARRPDVLVYQAEPVVRGITLAGPMTADLWVSTDAGDADWVVKLIDVYPPDAKDHPEMRPGRHLGGYQMLVRSEVIRGRFRESKSSPKPFKPDEPTLVKLPLQDVLHTFLPGHRIMVQIQSTWFPLVDRNPQKYVDNIFEADEKDFTPATHKVYHDAEHPTHLSVGVIE